MSSEHLTTEVLKGYVTRTLAPDELVRADRHLQTCRDCHGQLTEEMPMQDAASVILSEAYGSEADLDMHLSYDQLEAYVDGTIDGVSSEIADVHTADCLYCRDQLNDLRLMKELIARRTAPISPSIPAESFWEKIVSAVTLRAAFAAGALVVLGLGLWGLSVLRTSEPIETVVVDERLPADLPQNVALDPTNENKGGEVAGLDDDANSVTKPVISLIDGGSRLELDQNGKLSGIDVGRFEAKLTAVLSSQDIQVSPAGKELRSGSGVLMSGGSPGSPFALTSPVGRVIISDRPQFRWRPLADAESYIVSVFDENFTKVAESPALKQMTWTIDTRLKRGTAYNWQVTAIKAGEEIRSPVRPAPDAKFKIVDTALAADIEAARRTGSHLLLGTLYANAGMTAEAEREFQILVKQNPRSELARKLLRKVQINK